MFIKLTRLDNAASTVLLSVKNIDSVEEVVIATNRRTLVRTSNQHGTINYSVVETAEEINNLIQHPPHGVKPTYV